MNSLLALPTVGTGLVWTGIAIQIDGKIVVGGYANMGNASTGFDFVTARLNLDGTPDTTFDGDGIRALAIGAANAVDQANAIALRAGFFRRVGDANTASPTRRKNPVVIITICVDEMTGIQAQERIAPTEPMRPGHIERVAFGYTRHGTRCLMGNFEVATGQVIAPTVQATRGEKDFAAHIEQTVGADPEAEWIVVADNRTTHCSTTLVQWAASLCGIATESLGKKGTSGVLNSVAARKAFPIGATHRVRFVYVPEHTSWLNRVEIWFRVQARRVLRRETFRSTDDLREKILAYIMSQAV